MSAALPNRCEPRPAREGVTLATLGFLLRRRDRLARELAVLDDDIKSELRVLASLRGVGFIRIEQVKQELGL